MMHYGHTITHTPQHTHRTPHTAAPTAPTMFSKKFRLNNLATVGGTVNLLTPSPPPLMEVMMEGPMCSGSTVLPKTTTTLGGFSPHPNTSL